MHKRFILFVFCLSVWVHAQPVLGRVLIVLSTIESGPNYKIYTTIGLQALRWVGYPDPNYTWEGERLVWERVVKDEDGKDVTVKTYKDPIEIIANFKPESKVFGIEGNIEKVAVKKFGGALKGFVWLDKISGGGEVTLPFTAKHIFIATGDRLNPELTEIGTDPNSDNWYEIIDGKTRVVVKSFSGIGGAAGAPPTLIVHYKMNENTAGDNAELITNGDFSAWTGDNPDSWTVSGEVGSDPEISEVGTGESHGGAGTGMCNLYTSDGTLVSIQQTVATVIGRKYKFSFNIDTINAGNITVRERKNDIWVAINYTTTGIKTLAFVAVDTEIYLQIKRNGSSDVTFDNVSVKLLAVEDSSGNDHDGFAQQDTSAISVAGKINTAFDFTPNDYILIPDHDDFTPALTPFSISVWVYMHDVANFYIATKGVIGIDNEWRFFCFNGNVYIELFDESANARIGRITPVISANTWYHIVATYDGGTLTSGIRIYIDSVRVDDTDYTSGTFVAVENSTALVYIGRYVTVYANGLIDNVTFFSVELSQDDIKRLYNNRSGTELLAEIDPVISPRRSNTSPLGLRMRYEW